MPMHVQWSCQHITSACMKHFESSRRAYMSAKKRLDSVPKYVQAAKTWITENFMYPAVSDKDGIFVLLRTDQWNKLCVDQLSKIWYRPVFRSEVDIPCMRRAVQSLCCDMRKFVSHSCMTDVQSTISDTRNTWFSRFSGTVKTHKTVVVMRPLHTSSNHCLGGLTAWIDKDLSSVLKTIAHLCGSSRHVIDGLNKLDSLPSSAVLIKMDLKDFFLDGDHVCIIEACKQLIDEAFALGHCLPCLKADSQFDNTTFIRVLEFVLHHQYVDAGSDDCVYKVQTGSGMGMKHSASVSSACLYNIMEKECCSQQFMNMYSVKVYLRYHDDILAICDHPRQAREYCGILIDRAAKCYKLAVDEVSLVGVQMLDLFVYKTKCTPKCRVEYMPFIKPTARHIPLGPHSMHPDSVHKCWPVGEVIRMSRLSKHRCSFEHFKQLKINRFKHFGLDSEVVKNCLEWSPTFPSAIAKTFCRDKDPCFEKPLRMVFPYSDYVGVGIHHLCRSIQDNVNLLLQGDMQYIPFQVAFRNHGVPLFIQLRRLNMVKQ